MFLFKHTFFFFNVLRDLKISKINLVFFETDRRLREIDLQKFDSFNCYIFSTNLK